MRSGTAINDMRMPRRRIRTRLAKRVHKFFLRVTEPIDVVGEFLLGDWWRLIALQVQDAVAIGFLLWVPNHVFAFVSLGMNFSDLNSCLAIELSSPTFLACISVLAGEYCFWLLYGGRTLARLTRLTSRH